MSTLSEKALDARNGVRESVPENFETDLEKWERDRLKPAKVVIEYLPGEKEVPDSAFVEAGWSSDPRTGHAVLTSFGREINNPVPVAPPVGYRTGPTLLELFSQMLERRLADFAEDEVIDSVEDLEDFGEDVDEFPSSPYEFIHMKSDFPGNESGEEKLGEAAAGAPASAASEAKVDKPDAK